MEFLEEAYKAANAVAVAPAAGEQGRAESGGGEPSTPARGKTRRSNKEEEEGAFSDSEATGKDSAEGDRTTTGSDTEESADRRDSETAKGTSCDNDGGGNRGGAKGQGARGRRGSGSDTGANAAEPPGGSSAGGGRVVGFGVVGEGETVELALQALAKVCVLRRRVAVWLFGGLSCRGARREEDGCKHATSRAAEQR